MTKKERIEKHNTNVKEALDAANKGEVINMSALWGGKKQIEAGYDDEAEAIYSDNWKITKR